MRLSRIIFTTAAPAGVQTGRTITCPTGKKVLGGGVLDDSLSILVNLNGSIPLADGSGWSAWVNNASGASSNFVVYAVCAKKPKGYQVMDSSSLVPAGSQGSAEAVCPANTKVLGGGGVMASTAITENLNGSFPLEAGWEVAGNNGGGGSDSITVSVVCGKGVKGLRQVSGSAVSNVAGAQNTAAVACPSGTVPLSGGGLSTSGYTSVNLNTSIPSSNSWLVDENNGSPSNTSITAYAVCAK